MKRGVVGLRFEPGAEIEAPMSGVQLGSGQAGTVSVRLFRTTATRIVLAAQVLPAQLIAVRVTAAGTPVQVVTSRAQLWEPLLRHAPNCRVVRDATVLPPSGGPGLLIDDRPAEGRSPIDIRPWQCRIDIRTQWAPSELAGFAHYDLAVFGALPPEAARHVSGMFGLPRGAIEPLSRLDAASFGVVRRGHVDYVSLDPTSAEGQLLDQARGIGSASARLLT